MLMTLAQAAVSLGRAVTTLREQVHRGQLHATKIGRDWLVEDTEVERYRRESVERGPGRPVTTKFSEIRRPVTAERRVRIDKIKADEDR